jgi:hypothetical protein
MKKLNYILILLLLCSCNEKKHKDEIYDLINHAILDQYVNIGTSIITAKDTIIVDTFIIDPCAHQGFKVDTINGKIKLSNNTWSSSSANYERYFENNDLLYILSQLQDTADYCWDLQKLKTGVFRDTSLVTNTKLSISLLDVWQRGITDHMNYFTISKPLFNSSHSKALVSTALYLRKYFVSNIIEYTKDDGTWDVNSKHHLVIKIDKTNHPESIQDTVYFILMGTFESNMDRSY